MCVDFTRHNGLKWHLAMSNFHRAETKVTVTLFGLFFYSFGRRRTTAWHSGFESEIIIILNSVFRDAVKWKTNNEDGLYLSSGCARASQTRTRWSCACLGRRCAGFLSHSGLERKCGQYLKYLRATLMLLLSKGATPGSGAEKLIHVREAWSHRLHPGAGEPAANTLAACS